VACELNDSLLSLLLGSSPPGVEEGSGGVWLNEWGALLLYDQLTALVALVEDSALALVDETVKHLFEPLLWALRVLTLDRPGDVKRSGLLPSGTSGGTVLGDDSSLRSHRGGGGGWSGICSPEGVKRVLRRRADFSREAIDKLKLSASTAPLSRGGVEG
jgi:hypothetical protein